MTNRPGPIESTALPAAEYETPGSKDADRLLRQLVEDLKMIVNPEPKGWDDLSDRAWWIWAEMIENALHKVGPPYYTEE